jgi:hypothetical protein
MCPNFQSHSEGDPNSLDKGWEQDPTSNDVQVAFGTQPSGLYSSLHRDSHKIKTRNSGVTRTRKNIKRLDDVIDNIELKRDLCAVSFLSMD